MMTLNWYHKPKESKLSGTLACLMVVLRKFTPQLFAYLLFKAL
jgi:hypothetical protein